MDQEWDNELDYGLVPEVLGGAEEHVEEHAGAPETTMPDDRVPDAMYQPPGTQPSVDSIKNWFALVFENLNFGGLSRAVVPVVVWANSVKLMTSLDRVTTLMIFLVYFALVEPDAFMEYAVLSSVALGVYAGETEERSMVVYGLVALICLLLKISKTKPSWLPTVHFISATVIVAYSVALRKLTDIPMVSERVCL